MRHPEISWSEISRTKSKWLRGVGAPASKRGQIGSDQSFLHNVLVEVCLAVVGGYEGAQPGYGEGMAEHHLHVHPLGLLGPPSLLLLQLLDALRGRDGNKREWGESASLFLPSRLNAHLHFYKQRITVQRVLMWWLILRISSHTSSAGEYVE